MQVSQKEVHTPDARTIQLNEDRNPKGFVNNEIHTAKFGLVNFLPVFLFIMFRRVAYLYFLAQVGGAAQNSWPSKAAMAQPFSLEVLLSHGVKMVN